ncbi:MAG: tetratricopeptide repeat protein [Candidatus Krumholzibacteriia bacterium]
MRKGHTSIILGTAGAACVAIAIGFFSNNRNEFETSGTPPALDDVVLTSETSFEALEQTFGQTSEDVERAVPPSSTIHEPATFGPVLDVASVDLEAAGADGESAIESAEAATAEPVVDALPLAQMAFLQRDHETVVDHLEAAAGRGDGRYDVHYLLGLSLRYLGRYEESDAAMDVALDIAPNSVRALVNSARTLLELQRVADAEARVQQAIQLAPDDADAWNVLGRVRLAAGRSPEAEQAFTRATEIDSSHAWAFNNLGFVRLQREAWEEAAGALRKAIHLDSDVACFHNNLGVACERLGRLEDAAQAYAQAVRLSPEHTRAQVSLERVTPLLEAEVRVASPQEPAQEAAADGILVTEDTIPAEDVAVKP